ncbi:nucleoporin Seh1p [[Candida] railenensis]|uniref:Nucleoporin Seh1p n=1 Tax=[Candida] railenensis TaxID=45579 RepID=A0A9P0QKZ6_9ASCO|nr:nucleoporin Seh1p [[Candida] railenensis]
MKPFITGHEDLIHDIKYDFYGKHIATASSDQHLKVFDLDSSTSTWVLNDSWKAHDSSVVKVSWAHPEFCSSKILASCSYDRTVKIWQEQPDELHGSGRRWIKLATLAIESYGPIYDVEFAPNHLGLKLGCIGSDGIFRIYESLEPADLTSWGLSVEIPVLSSQLPAKNLQSSFAIEWCPSKFSRTEKFIVIALDQGFIYGARQSNSSNAPPGDSGNAIVGGGGDSHINAIGAGNNTIHGDKGLGVGNGNTSRVIEDDLDGLNQEGGDSSSSETKFVKICNLPEHNGLIRSVSWAPSMGRNYHLIATGCKDGYVRIFKAEESNNGDLKIETIAALSDHESEVWQVSWNLTGTILSSAGDDGKVRLWKRNYLNEWKCMSVINSSNRSINRMTTKNSQ